MKNYKEIGLLVSITIVLSTVGFNLFQNQPESKFIEAGALVLPSQTSGGAGRCNIPNYENYYRSPSSTGNDSLSVKNDGGML